MLASGRQDERLWLARIDRALHDRQAALALERIRQAEARVGPNAQLHFRAAQAYYQLGQALGGTRVLRVPGGRAGQFFGDWLLVERRREPDWFLCCPRQSALYQMRQALDAGLDEPAAHCLHARIWQQAGRPEVGWSILRGHETLLLERPSPQTLASFAELALAVGALDDFLRYAHRRAALEPRHGTAILADAYRRAAERCSQRGDELLCRALLRCALALVPDDAELALRLADSLWDAGARDEARLWYRRVLEREPAHRARTRVLRRLAE